jgi:glycosyltransferase domain-containing protein
MSRTNPAAGPVTILLPLKGRHLHTLRYIYHLNRTNFPFPLIIADGEVHPIIAQLLEDHRTFPNLSYEYIRCPNDSTYSQFYRKMVDATRRVKTRYAMLTDNDDFPCAEGITRVANFLDANLDYSSCGGRVGGFELLKSLAGEIPQLTGRLARLETQYGSLYSPFDVEGKNVPRQYLSANLKPPITYYHIFRTEVLNAIHKELEDLDFSDLTIHETYFMWRSLLFGKVKTNGGVITYLRQHGTSTLHSHKADWAAHLLRSRFNDDFNTMLKTLSDQMVAASGEDASLIAEGIFEAYATRLRADLQDYYFTYAPSPYVRAVKTLLSPAFRLRQEIRTLPERMLPQRHTEQLCSRFMTELKAVGADTAYLRTFRNELREITHTLSGGQFTAFLNERAPVLLGA